MGVPSMLPAFPLWQRPAARPAPIFLFRAPPASAGVDSMRIPWKYTTRFPGTIDFSESEWPFPRMEESSQKYYFSLRALLFYTVIAS